MMRNRMFLFTKARSAQAYFTGNAGRSHGTKMERKWNANGTQTSGRAKTTKKGVFPPFYAEEQKDREIRRKNYRFFGSVTTVTVVTVF